MKMPRRPAPAFAAAWALFLIAALSPQVLYWAFPAWNQVTWVEHAVTKTVLLVLALLAMAMSRGSWADWGFCAPVRPRWGRGVLRGAALGAAASALLILTPAGRLSWVAELGLHGLVLWVWIYSSVTEEIFVRGWFQAFLSAEADQPASIGGWVVSRRVALSGLLFGSLHLSTIARGADPWMVCILVSTTTALGLCAADDRERTGSLGPPIATHAAFNVGGLVGAVVTAAAVFAVTGRPPST